MMRAVLLTCVLSALRLRATAQEPPSYPTFGYDVVQAHEIKPHRMRVPMNDVVDGSASLPVGRPRFGQSFGGMTSG